MATTATAGRGVNACGSPGRAPSRPFAAALLILLAWLGWLAPAAASSWPSGSSGLTIRVLGEGWGGAEHDEIESVLHAVAAELVPDASEPTQPILVSHAPGNPVTLFVRGAEGEFQVRLSARGRGWAQYVYQFGHELCHVMSNFQAQGNQRARNQWFEEALCEAAGLYALRATAVRWQTAPPYPGWDDYAPALRAYADRLVAEQHRRLPDGVALGAWLHERLATLARDPYRRQDNEVVANLLLARFEREPAQWAALRYLSLDAADAVVDLAAYLRHWHDNAPDAHRSFIDALTDELGVADVAADRRTSLSVSSVPGPRFPARAGAIGPLAD